MHSSYFLPCDKDKTEQATAFQTEFSQSCVNTHCSCRLLHCRPSQSFEWNYFPLLIERIVLSNKIRNFRKYSVVFFVSIFQKKVQKKVPIQSLVLWLDMDYINAKLSASDTNDAQKLGKGHLKDARKLLLKLQSGMPSVEHCFWCQVSISNLDFCRNCREEERVLHLLAACPALSFESITYYRWSIDSLKITRDKFLY